jgi:hypothetical protein
MAACGVSSRPRRPWKPRPLRELRVDAHRVALIDLYMKMLDRPMLPMPSPAPLAPCSSMSEADLYMAYRGVAKRP